MENRYELFFTSIACLYHDIQKIQRVEMAKFQLKGPHVQCLLAMRRCPDGITAAQLCEICERDKASISRTISELEEAGMVLRQSRNGNGYRAKLTLSSNGAAAAEAVRNRTLQAVEQAGLGLDDEKRAVFYEALALIANNLHTICKDGLKEA